MLSTLRLVYSDRPFYNFFDTFLEHHSLTISVIEGSPLVLHERRKTLPSENRDPRKIDITNLHTKAAAVSINIGGKF